MPPYYRSARNAQRRANLFALVQATVWALALVVTLAFLLASAILLATDAGADEGGQYREPEGCTKIEFPPGQQTFTIPFTGSWTIKAGTLVETFTFPEGTTIAATNSKDISHVIGCPLPPPPTYPTVPPTTTEPPVVPTSSTVPPTTTTEAPVPSTTVQPPTTTVAPPPTPPVPPSPDPEPVPDAPRFTG